MTAMIPRRGAVQHRTRDDYKQILRSGFPAALFQPEPLTEEDSAAETFGFTSLGEQLASVIEAGRLEEFGRGGRVDLRLLQERAIAPAGASEQVPADGGFLVAPQFSRAIVRRMYRVGEILRRCTEIPISASNSIKFPQYSEDSRANGSRLGGVQVWAENEADTIIASRPKFQNTELAAKKYTGLVYLTDELMADTDALTAWAEWAYSQEMTFQLENDIVNGSGAGRAQGILQAPGLITVSEETGQSPNTVLHQNCVNMLSRLWPPSRESTAWLYNPALLPQLSQLSVTVGTGGSVSNLWQYASGDGEWDSLGGLPAIPSEYAQQVSSQGDLILCDFSRYAVGMRERLQTDVSMHVKFLTNEVALRFIMRVDGTPIDRSPITPLNSSTTLSPYVALQSR